MPRLKSGGDQGDRGAVSGRASPTVGGIEASMDRM